MTQVTRGGVRVQQKGKQKPWTLRELEAGLQQFYKGHGRYPTASEVDSYQHLPSARTVERKFGGLVALRRQLRLRGQADFRGGEHSSERAFRINKRAHETEEKVFSLLKGRFGREFVHREYFFTDDKRTRADFFVYDAKTGFCVDVFYPENRRNLLGCLNSKLNKYRPSLMHQYPVIFLQMNEGIEQAVLDQLVNNKKRALGSGQHLMSWPAFQSFCKLRNPLKISRRSMEPNQHPRA